MKKQNTLRLIFFISLIGVLFSGYLSAMEIFVKECPVGGCSSLFGFPVCIYGLLMYLIIMYLSRKGLKAHT